MRRSLSIDVGESLSLHRAGAFRKQLFQRDRPRDLYIYCCSCFLKKILSILSSSNRAFYLPLFEASSLCINLNLFGPSNPTSKHQPLNQQQPHLTQSHRFYIATCHQIMYTPRTRPNTTLSLTLKLSGLSKPPIYTGTSHRPRLSPAPIRS